MTINKMVSFGKVLALAISVLGIIHIVATFTPLIQAGLACLDPGTYKAMIFMSLVCGGFFVLCGIILYLFFKKTELKDAILTIIMTIGLFLGVSGFLSVFYMPENPFAWIIFLLCTNMAAISVGLKVKSS